jgi:predicted nucleic acid-binding protein
MNDRSFLDTNVFVYSVDRTEPAKVRRATQLINDAVRTGKGVVSYQVVQEFFHVALRRFAQPMTSADAEQYLLTVFRPLLAIHSSEGIFLAALRLQARYRFSWYDSLIVAAALHANCGVLYSEDLQHGQKIESLKIVNPFLAP